jgi:hypothetical protein
MAVQRIRFNISTDTGGDFVGTSGPCEGGLIMQLRNDTGTFDTGCDVKLEALNSNGSLMPIANYTNVLGHSWTRVPRILSYDTGGAALGDQYPVVLGGDTLKLTVTQSGGVAGSKTGKFWVWVGW